MANEYFTPSGYPATGAAGSSASMRSELALVEDGFDKLPTLTGNGGKIVAVNSGGTGLTTSATLSESGGTMTVTGNLSVTGDTTLGNASGDALTIASSAVTWSGNPTHSGNHTFSGGLTLASPLPTSSGGTGLSSFTANRVFYSSSTSAIGSSANLTFNGTTLATSAFTATGNVNLNGGTFTFNDAGADLDARFEGDTDASLLFLDASTDRVGIGTNSPASKLHLGNNLTTTNTIPFQIGYAADFYGYRLINTNNPGSTAAGTFSLQRGTTAAWVDVLTSDDNGNVGIGTTTPNAKFDVASSSFFPAIASTRTGTGTWYVGGDNVGSTSSFRITLNTSNFVTVTTGGDVGIGVTNPAYKLVVSAGGASGIEFGPAFSGTANLIQSYNRSGSAYVDTVYEAAQHRFNLSSVEAVRITSGGNLGIGTASPAQILDIVRTQNSATVTVVRNASTGATASAQFVANADTATGRFAAYSSGAGALANHVSIEQTTNNPITFYTNSSERVRITGAGDVGIGTASPGAAVHVVAAANTIPCIFDAPTTGYSYITMRTNGSVYGYFGQGNALISSGSATAAAIRSENELLFSAGGSTERMRITATGNISAGAGAVATTATDGFLYVPTCAGTPTGTPTAITGMAPIVVDTTNNKLYFYSGGQWRDAGP